jgi:predicted amidohydrolase
MKKVLCSWKQDAQAGNAYQPQVQLRTGMVTPSVIALLEWYGPDNKLLERTYLSQADNGWKSQHVAPPRTESLRVSLIHFQQLGEASASEADFTCQEVPVPAARNLVVATSYQCAAEPATLENNIKVLCDTVCEAANHNVQLLCMTEHLPSRHVEGNVEERSLTLDDERLQPLWKAIRDAQLWTVFTVHEKRGSKYHNTAVLASPNGKVFGTYEKQQLTLSELEYGVTPGNKTGVFETPIGRIGIVTCWDAWFPETAVGLAKADVDIVCFPLAGDLWDNHWDHGWRSRAMDTQAFWLSSVTQNCVSKCPSRIIAPSGEVLAETRETNGLAFAEINVAHRERAWWLSVGGCDSEVRNVFYHSRFAVAPKAL